MTDELGRIVGRTRPQLGSDEDWADSAAAKRTLAEIHRRTKRPARRSAWRPLHGLGVGVAAAAVAAAVAVPMVLRDATGPVPPGGSGVALPPLPSARPDRMVLATYDTCGDLLAGLRRQTAKHVGPYGLPTDYRHARGPWLAPMPTTLSDVAAKQAASAPGSYSTTNVQEQGVDEMDLLKTDGRRIVSVSDGLLRVVDAASRQVTSTLRVGPADGSMSEVLLAGDRVLVSLAQAADPRFVLVDLSGEPRVLETLTTSRGNFLDARLVGTTVRLVVATTPRIQFPAYDPKLTNAQRTERNRAAVNRATVDAWLPRFEVATPAGSTQTRTVPCDRVSSPKEFTGTSLLSVYTFDLAQNLGALEPMSLVADGSTVYATEASLYVATSSNPWMWCVRCGMPSATTGKAETEVHRFDTAGGAVPRYLGSGSVPGYLLSRYSLSDHDGYLRIATTTPATGATSSSSAVQILDLATLKSVGAVKGLGKNEQIYAVRFVGPTAYVVTFRRTDPLYVLDLSNPRAPRTTGELKITGYSSYLHPAGDGRLIGVGQEATTAGRTTGMQVSLFDVADPANPVRVAQVFRKEVWGDLADPHAFLYWPATGLVVVPLPDYRTANQSALVLRVTGKNLSTVGTVTHPSTGERGDSAVQRSAMIDGTLWTLSTSGLMANSPDTLAQQQWISFA